MKYLFENETELNEFIQKQIAKEYSNRNKGLFKLFVLVSLIFFCLGLFFGVRFFKPTPKVKPPSRISVTSGKYHLQQFNLSEEVDKGTLTKQRQEELEKQVDSITPIVGLPSDKSSPSIKAFMDTISWAEGTYRYGYKTHYGGFAIPNSLNSYFPCFPYKSEKYGIVSTACGKYQILDKTWKGIAPKIKANSFTPINQEKACLYLLDRKLHLIPILKYYGDYKGIKTIEKAIYRASGTWASLPKNKEGKSFYKNQQAKRLNDLLYVYKYRYNYYLQKDRRARVKSISLS